jgi:hypothetical protein
MSELENNLRWIEAENFILITCSDENEPFEYRKWLRKKKVLWDRLSFKEKQELMDKYFKRRTK